MDEVTNIISRELLKLTYNDRNAIYEEMHGVRCLAVDETPELLTRALLEFQNQLDRIPAIKKEAYAEILRLKQLKQIEIIKAAATAATSTATSVPPPVPPIAESAACSFIDDEAFRLRFLRCELFDVRKAAIRFVNYLNLAYELWGGVALTRQIRITDFTKSEMRFFRKGYYQILPYRDRAGRRVITLMGGMGLDINSIENTKCFFYVRDAATRDSIESQRKGVVFVGDVSAWKELGTTDTTSTSTDSTSSSSDDDGSSSFQFPSNIFAMTKKVISSVPTRMVAIHNCWPDTPKFRLLNMLYVVNSSSGSNYLMRILSQVGNELEMRYTLKGYGIPVHLFPLTETGGIKVKYFNEWTKIRKMLEEGEQKELKNKKKRQQQQRQPVSSDDLRRIVECPGLNDVVFRQGTPSMKNPGNVIFRDMMITHLEEYFDQHQYYEEQHHQQPEHVLVFCNWLIANIENHRGGHFLEWDKGLNVWVRMKDRERLKNKVAISFRDTTKRFINHKRNMLLYATTRTSPSSSTSTDMEGVVIQADGGDNNNNGKGNNNNRDNNTTIDNDNNSYIFVEGGEKSRQQCCSTSRNIPPTIVPLRSDSNYNESSYCF